jgi:hypothetical protein
LKGIDLERIKQNGKSVPDEQDFEAFKVFFIRIDQVLEEQV